MKRFKQHINEALDKPYRFDSVYKDRSEWMYDFTLDDGRQGQVEIVIRGSRIDVNFDVDGEIKKTGGGDQFRIFATVRKALEDFLSNYSSGDIDSIRFEASKDTMSVLGSRVSLYAKFAKKLAKKYGTSLTKHETSQEVIFVMDADSPINEEWVTNNDWVGDMFKNPNPRELAEYLKTIGPYNIAGILYKKDVYIFDGMHEDGVEEIAKHEKTRVTDAHIRFRGSVKGGKMVALGPSGGDPIEYYGYSHENREWLFESMLKVFKNKYLKTRMGNFDAAFEEVYRVFMKADELDHFFALKEKYKIK